MPNTQSIHDAYTSGTQKILDLASNLSFQKALFLARKATVYHEVEKMEVFDHLWFKLSQNIGHETEPEKISALCHEMGLVTKEACDCYANEADDLILFAAFEQYIKSELLKNGFVVHKITNNSGKNVNHPAKKQRIEKVSIVDIKNYESSTGESVEFSEHTIGASVFLECDYLDILDLSDQELEGIKLMRDRRNSTHFDAQIKGRSAPYPASFYAAVKYIKRVTQWPS